MTLLCQMAQSLGKQMQEVQNLGKRMQVLRLKVAEDKKIAKRWKQP